MKVKSETSLTNPPKSPFKKGGLQKPFRLFPPFPKGGQGGLHEDNTGTLLAPALKTIRISQVGRFIKFTKPIWSQYKILFIIASMTLVLFNPPPCQGENIVESTLLSGIGLRPLGMGGAFVAVVDNAQATYWNPAGLGDLVGLYFGWEKMEVEDIDEPFSASLIKHSSGSLVFSGLGYSWWNVRGDYDDDLGLEDLQVHLLGVGLATEVGLNLGSTFKLLTHQDEIGWGLDLGILAHISPLASWGLNVQNLFEPTVSAGIKVTPTTKTGFAFYPLAENYPELAQDLTFALDADIGRSDGFMMHYGLEGRLWDETLSLRIGYDVDRVSFGTSLGSPLLTIDYLGHLANDRLENSLGLTFSIGFGLEGRKYLSEYNIETQEFSEQEPSEEE